MKELHSFILNYTSANGWYEDEYRFPENENGEIELKIWNQVLNPCGMPRWYLNHFIRHPDHKRPEDVAIALEENLIHPIFAMQVMKVDVVKVYQEVARIAGKIHLKYRLLAGQLEGP